MTTSEMNQPEKHFAMRDERDWIVPHTGLSICVKALAVSIFALLLMIACVMLCIVYWRDLCAESERVRGIAQCRVCLGRAGVGTLHHRAGGRLAGLSRRSCPFVTQPMIRLAVGCLAAVLIVLHLPPLIAGRAAFEPHSTVPSNPRLANRATQPQTAPGDSESIGAVNVGCAWAFTLLSTGSIVAFARCLGRISAHLDRKWPLLLAKWLAICLGIFVPLSLCVPCCLSCTCAVGRADIISSVSPLIVLAISGILFTLTCAPRDTSRHPSRSAHLRAATDKKMIEPKTKPPTCAAGSGTRRWDSFSWYLWRLDADGTGSRPARHGGSASRRRWRRP